MKQVYILKHPNVKTTVKITLQLALPTQSTLKYCAVERISISSSPSEFSFSSLCNTMCRQDVVQRREYQPMDTATSTLELEDNNLVFHQNEDPPLLAAQDIEVAQGRFLPFFCEVSLLLGDSYEFNRTPRYPYYWLWKVANWFRLPFTAFQMRCMSMVCLAGCIYYNVDIHAENLDRQHDGREGSSGRVIIQT